MKIQLHLFFVEQIDLREVVLIFHRWIQEERLPGLLLDVTDYRHVPQGPGVLLIGHEGDYGITLAENRVSIYYKHKRGWPADFSELGQQVGYAFARVQEAADLLAKELNLTIDPSERWLILPDRLRYPNTASRLAALEEELQHSLIATQYESERLYDRPVEPLGIRYVRRVEAINGR